MHAYILMDGCSNIYTLTMVKSCNGTHIARFVLQIYLVRKKHWEYIYLFFFFFELKLTTMCGFDPQRDVCAFGSNIFLTSMSRYSKEIFLFFPSNKKTRKYIGTSKSNKILVKSDFFLFKICYSFSLKSSVNGRTFQRKSIWSPLEGPMMLRTVFMGSESSWKTVKSCKTCFYAFLWFVLQQLCCLENNNKQKNKRNFLLRISFVYNSFSFAFAKFNLFSRYFSLLNFFFFWLF